MHTRRASRLHADKSPESTKKMARLIANVARRGKAREAHVLPPVKRIDSMSQPGEMTSQPGVCGPSRGYWANGSGRYDSRAQANAHYAHACGPGDQHPRNPYGGLEAPHYV
jgi:hypothetical protein